MDRIQLQQLAELRLEDARTLLDAKRWGAAYYLLGYSIECALKACVAKQFGQHQVPDRKLVNSFFTHDLVELLSISGVKSSKEERSTDKNFQTSWDIVKDWNESFRYDLGITEKIASDMYEAVTNEQSGILPWLRTLW
jgi:hypothetical protein